MTRLFPMLLLLSLLLLPVWFHNQENNIAVLKKSLSARTIACDSPIFCRIPFHLWWNGNGRFLSEVLNWRNQQFVALSMVQSVLFDRFQQCWWIPTLWRRNCLFSNFHEFSRKVDSFHYSSAPSKLWWIYFLQNCDEYNNARLTKFDSCFGRTFGTC